MARVTSYFQKFHTVMTIVFIITVSIITTVWMVIYRGNGVDIFNMSNTKTNWNTNMTYNTTETININNAIINIPHSPRYTLLHKKRQKIMSTYTNHDYDCDYIHVKGTGKSGTTWLKISLHKIEAKLCDKTDYKKSYHFKHSPYSMCKDWTNGTAEYIQHATNYNRHALHDIKDVLITQEMRYKDNDTAYSKYFMGYDLYDKWKKNELRYCVFLVSRDPRNRVISRANTWNKKLNNYTMITDEEKNKIFMDSFEGILQSFKVWWDKYSELEMDNVMDYYLYFYEDIRMYQYEILKDMIWFAGYDKYIDDELIREIMDETDIDKSSPNSYTVNNGDLCSFHSENSLTEETKRYANKLMLEVLNDDLIQKFNRTCHISL